MLETGMKIDSVKDGDSDWSNELDNIPFVQRLKLLKTKKITSSSACHLNAENKADELCISQRSSGGSNLGSVCDDVQAVKLENSKANDFVDDLDHIVLKERLRMLISRKTLATAYPIIECDRNTINPEWPREEIRRQIHRNLRARMNRNRKQESKQKSEKEKEHQ